MLSTIFKLDISPSRVYGLDILRAWAILFVVLGHGNYLLPPKLATFISYFLIDGVSLFFVLSGFLIGRILIKTLESSENNWTALLHFWKRRWYRTIPNYLLVLTFLVAMSLMISDSFELVMSIPYFLFGQNLFDPHPWFFPEAWSLSIEEWFYLVVPAILMLLVKAGSLKPSQSIITVSILLILSTTIFRYYRFETHDVSSWIVWDDVFRKQVSTRLDSIMYGVIGAYTSYYHHDVWVRYKKQLLFAGLSIFAFFNIYKYSIGFQLSLFTCVFSFSIVSIATLCLLPFLSEYNTKKSSFYKPLTYLSIISYSLYLIHLTSVQGALLIFADKMNLSLQKLNIDSLLIYASYWIISIIASILIYKFWESPMTKLRDK